MNAGDERFVSYKRALFLTVAATICVAPIATGLGLRKDPGGCPTFLWWILGVVSVTGVFFVWHGLTASEYEMESNTLLSYWDADSLILWVIALPVFLVLNVLLWFKRQLQDKLRGFRNPGGPSRS